MPGAAFDAATGAPVDVPYDQLADAWRSGRVHLSSAQPYHLQFQNGTFGHASDPQAIANALDNGARFVDPEVAQAELQGRKYESETGGAIGAGLAGGAAGLTLGLSDVAGRAIGGEGYAAARRYQQSAHPYASMAGEAVGGIGLAAATAGLGGAALGVEGAEAAGEAAEASSLVGRVAARAGAGMAKGAAEGAQIGVQQAISDDAISDKPLTAAQILSTVGSNVLWGGGLGGGFGALGALAGAATDRLGSSLARRAGGDADALESVAGKTLGVEPAPGLGAKLKEFLGGVISAASGKDPAVIDSFLTGPNAEANRAALLEADATRAQAVRKITQHVDNVLESSRDILDEQKRPLKIGYIRDAVDGVDADAAAKSARDAIDTVQTHIEEMLQSPDDYGGEKALRSAEKIAQQASDRLDVAQGIEGASYRQGPGQRVTNTTRTAPDVAEMFATVDDLKKGLGTYARGATQIADAAGMNATDELAIKQNRLRASKLAEAYEGLRTSLEDESTWGKAATNQKAINAAWSAQIDAESRFKGALTTKGGRAGPFSSMREDIADPGKASSYVNGLLDPGKDLTHQTVNDYLDATKRLADTIGESVQLPSEKHAQLERLRTAVAGFKSTTDEAGKSLALVNQFEAMRRTTGGHGEAFRVGLMGLGHAIGGLPGGVAGMALGRVGGIFTRPAETVMQLAQFERMARESDNRIVRGLRGLMNGSHVPAQRTSVEAFARKAEQIGKLDAATAQTRVAKNLAGLREKAPKLADAMTITSLAGLHFLQSKLPPQSAIDPLDPDRRPLPIGMAQQQKWLRYYDAVRDPLRVIDELRSGRPNSEGVEALKTVYPPLYQKVQASAMAMIASGKTSDATRQQRMMLGITLGLPLPELDARYILSRQTIYAGGPTDQGQPTGAPAKRGAKVDLAGVSALQSPADRVETGDMTDG